MVLQQKLWMGKCVWIQDSNRAYQINLTLRNFFYRQFHKQARTDSRAMFLSPILPLFHLSLLVL